MIIKVKLLRQYYAENQNVPNIMSKLVQSKQERSKYLAELG